jgi:hypothetical protein
MYRIYQNSDTGHIVPVKAKFQWLAFLAPNYWAWMRGLIGLGWIHTILFVLLGWTGIVPLIQLIYQGVKAAQHHGGHLMSRGYVDRGEIEALDDFDAIGKFAASAPEE